MPLELRYCPAATARLASQPANSFPNILFGSSNFHHWFIHICGIAGKSKLQGLKLLHINRIGQMSLQLGGRATYLPTDLPTYLPTFLPTYVRTSENHICL